MWFRLRFNLFGREIWSIEVDEDGLSSLAQSEEEYYEDQEDEEEEEPLRWGEPAYFERDIFVPDQSV